MKLCYYAALCEIVISIVSIITELIFADEINLFHLHDNCGFLLFGIFAMLYIRLRRYNKIQEDNFFCTILAIKNVCDDEGFRKIREEANRLSDYLQVDQKNFAKEYMQYMQDDPNDFCKEKKGKKK